MIETYKLLTGKYDQQVALALPKNVTGEYLALSNFRPRRGLAF